MIIKYKFNSFLRESKGIFGLNKVKPTKKQAFQRVDTGEFRLMSIYINFPLKVQPGLTSYQNPVAIVYAGKVAAAF